MMEEFCIIHQKRHTSEGGWRYKSWEMEHGTQYGWGCAEKGELTYPEFVPQKFHEDRRKYLKSQIQSHRQGELSKEFVELYPDKVKAMKKAGVINDKEVKSAKNVWQDLPGIQHVAKTE